MAGKRAVGGGGGLFFSLSSQLCMATEGMSPVAAPKVTLKFRVPGL